MLSFPYYLINPGIARLCCDSRRQVRSQALTYLQRALLVHDLQTLSAVEWESCFNKVWFALTNNEQKQLMVDTRVRTDVFLSSKYLKTQTLINIMSQVLFPLLSRLLEVINSQDPQGIEETRMRASTLLCKVSLRIITHASAISDLK